MQTIRLESRSVLALGQVKGHKRSKGGIIKGQKDFFG